MPKRLRQPIEKSMAEVDSISREFLTYEKRVDRFGETDSNDGQRDPGGKEGGGSGAKGGPDFCYGPPS